MAGKGDNEGPPFPRIVPRNGRPPHVPDARTARQVEAMAGYGVPLANIAKVVGISENTMRKYYLDEIELGATKANAKVSESLFRKATGDGPQSVTAAIFWSKVRCGWREVQRHEYSGPDGGPIPQAHTMDLSKLDDAQLEALARLVAVAGGSSKGD